MFILTSANTFSAGEGFAFVLQDLGRAKVVGERTPGAANPGRSYPVNDLFEVLVPNSYVRSAGTGGNWEGAGVIPDLAATGHEALNVAHCEALQLLLRETKDSEWAEVLRNELERLTTR